MSQAKARTGWTTPAGLRAQIAKLWQRGELLSSLISGEPLFPKHLTLKCPSSADTADRFDEVRAWIAELNNIPHCRIEMREVKHRLFGANAVPHEAWIGTLEDALALYREWDRLLAIVAWRQAHPHPGVYLRQIDIPGVHSKFIEAHRGVLAELLGMVLAPEEIDSSASGIGQFAQRYRFRNKPARIRFHILDPAHCLLPDPVLQDITLDAESFARLAPPRQPGFHHRERDQFFGLSAGKGQPGHLRIGIRV